MNIPSAAILVAIVALVLQGIAQETSNDIPGTTKSVVRALKSAQWAELESGINVIRAITETGVVMTAYRISAEEYNFSVVTQLQNTGSRVKDIGELEGAVLATNAGFFAEKLDGNLYPIGYLRLDGKLLSKGWENDGGIISLGEDGNLTLSPTHEGIPKQKENAIQSRPMLIEPGAQWAMSSNIGEVKNRTIVCKLQNGDVVLGLVTRVGMSLFEAGWIMREEDSGGFFGCDSALALDGGRSTQVWYSGNQGYSYPGLVPVHNFLIVRAKVD